MRDLNYDLKQLCRHNRDGSYAPSGSRTHPRFDRRPSRGDGVPAYERPQPQAQARGEAGRALARREPLSRDHQEPDVGAQVVGREGRQGEHRRPQQRRLWHSGPGVRHQHFQSQGSRHGPAATNPHPVHPHLAAAAGRLRPEAGRVDQDRPEAGRS